MHKFLILAVIMVPFLTSGCQKEKSQLSQSPMVEILPIRTSIGTGQVQQFVVRVSGMSDTTVIWHVNGIRGGNATIGTISAGGLYKAPAKTPCVRWTVTIKACCSKDTTKSAEAEVDVISSESTT